MVLFKFRRVIFCLAESSIYIPLWSYSNEIFRLQDELLDIFTFHYGPIQISKLKNNDTSITLFTFHYGPIQMELLKHQENVIK